MKENLVWYACYGSNLNEHRFNYYIKGGTYPVTGSVHYGCKDKTLSRASALKTIPHSLYFSKSSKSWENKAIAFITSQENPDNPAKCVLYLVTQGQFIDILLQENGEKPENFTKPTPNLEALKDGKETNLGNKNDYRDYGKLLYLGKHDSYPVYSFTAKINDVDIKPSLPGGNYLTVIGTGLMEKHKMTPEMAAFYLMNQRGVKKDWNYKQILILLKKFNVKPTSYRYNPNGTFLAQMTKEDVKSLGLKAHRWPYRNNIDIIVTNEFKSFNPKINEEDIYTYKVSARLHVYDVKKEHENSSKLKNGEIRLDQTIRDALGVTFGDLELNRVKIESRKTTWIGFKKLSFGFDKQLNIARVTRATPTYMEVNICSLEQAAMKSIGVEEGDKIIVESASKKITIRALCLNSEKIIERKNAHDVEDNHVYHKFHALKKFKSEYEKVAAKKTVDNETIKGEESLSLIFLDNDARKKLNIDVGDPVSIYRSNKYAIFKNMHAITIPLVLAFIGIGTSINGWLTRMNTGVDTGMDTGMSTGQLILINIAFYFICALALILLNLNPIRNKFK